ncbi:hypothetical protein HYO65_gp070 [Tenacibaculum phage PTm1]|uniref:Uncharacterized protein n=2 Tax=Shirahamavirus PTm1 TaxID=2846435 RepID=A0A5S9HY20_9CAUD|nr:hypothetical protein HYO65_gp070 [Tenacibaculum phage PTm1]BBI90462.1 hypothetical protein [Tenacibaculum phage PTm1]BBI90770.1 hypothetical protein [Tenacibaculum phage PTm5]
MSKIKTIYISKYLSTQNNLITVDTVVCINGSVTVDDRKEIFRKFNENEVDGISVTVPFIKVGGFRIIENGRPINIVFTDDVPEQTRQKLLTKINIKN